MQNVFGNVGSNSEGARFCLQFFCLFGSGEILFKCASYLLVGLDFVLLFTKSRRFLITTNASAHFLHEVLVTSSVILQTVLHRDVAVV